MNIRMFIVTLLIVSLSTVSIARQPISFADVIERNMNEYNVMKLKLYKELRFKADEDLWDYPMKNARWFTDKFYSSRGNDRVIISQFSVYLFPENIWEDYLFATAIRIDLEMQKLVRNIIEKSGYAGNRRIGDVVIPLNSHKILKENLLNTLEITKSIYRHLEKRGHNKVPASWVQKSYERFVARYPKTSMSLSIFATIAVGTVNPVAGGATGVYLAASQVGIYNDKQDWHQALVAEIIQSHQQFNTCLKNVTFSMFDGVLHYMHSGFEVEMDKVFDM